MRIPIRLSLAVLGAHLIAAEVGAVLLTVGSGQASRAFAPVEICVGLELGEGEQVAGTENQLAWDGTCATLAAESCRENPSHGKMLFGSIQPRLGDFRFKGIVVSLENTDPMPAGELYCCEFLVHPDPGDCCGIAIEEPGASDPDGNALTTASGAPGEVCLDADPSSPLPSPTSSSTFGAATATPTFTPKTVEPTPIDLTPVTPRVTATAVASQTHTPVENGSRTRKPTATRGRGSDDDGCSIGSERTTGAWWMWAPAAAGLVLRRRRRRAQAT